MHIDLTGKSAIVSGSTAGIGLAIARGLASTGARVVVTGRTQDRVDRAIEEIRKSVAHANLEGVAADLSTAAGVATLGERVASADILVNNLGTAVPKPFDQLTDDDWLRIFDFNVMSGVRLTRRYLPGMVASGWGRVVFISSESALHIPKEMIDYAMTKTALLAISRGLAEQVAGTGVTVNAVIPGPTSSESLTGWLEPVAREQGKTLEQVQKDFIAANRPTSLLGRFASTEEIANMVVYVCSKQAVATTGAALRVDGGILRSIG
ncbi:SDR family NAD(P)-dependent oxidoreductase [Variovorax boronicumulans]|nr:SDR family oxidoreductase [Variovorax boronicumulans]MDP9993992.1 NAD(P)-dependent dehydrogenase (short-subunit alcohol dehydrogenase family) [Variovorax boronicumulans]MDQ0044680.1 NAD(P)-dependent dehydrogenase (short-subunit alcohol dehydrogenase family) [Variovorax boronicumulans]